MQNASWVFWGFVWVGGNLVPGALITGFDVMWQIHTCGLCARIILALHALPWNIKAPGTRLEVDRRNRHVWVVPLLARALCMKCLMHTYVRGSPVPRHTLLISHVISPYFRLNFRQKMSRRILTNQVQDCLQAFR